MALIIPKKYKRKLLPETTEVAIKDIKEAFQEKLATALNLRRVTAPLFVLSGTGLNDDLNGIEKAVTFTIVRPFLPTSSSASQSLSMQWHFQSSHY